LVVNFELPMKYTKVLEIVQADLSADDIILSNPTPIYGDNISILGLFLKHLPEDVPNDLIKADIYLQKIDEKQELNLILC